jgi:histidine kinase family protein
MTEEVGDRRSRFPSVSRPLQVLALAVLVVIIAATAQQLLAVRSAIIEDTKRQMSRLDMVFAEQTGRAVETVDFILRNAIETLQGLQAKPPIDAGAFDELLRRRIHGVRQVTEVAVTDAAGQILYSSREGPPGDLPASARVLIEALAGHPEAGLQVSEPFRGPDGEWTALMIRRISGRDGGFGGAAIGFLNLRYFEDFYKAVELSENGAILLHLRDGTVLARYPHIDAVVGKTYADLPPFKDILARDIAGTTVMDSPIDGTRRVLAIRALKAFPLAVNVSVGESKVLASWRRQTWIFSAVAAGASVVIVGLLLSLAQRSAASRIAGPGISARKRISRAGASTTERANERTRAGGGGAAPGPARRGGGSTDRGRGTRFQQPADGAHRQYRADPE